MAGSLAITQESSANTEGSEPPADGDTAALVPENEEEPEPFEPFPGWVTPARWYRSNSGGMMLEEIPSRLAAMRNEYALVSDFIEQDELPEILLPYYDGHYIEIRVLYRNREELRRQWIFRDANGLYRLVAVFMEAENDSPKTDEAATSDTLADEAAPPAEDDSAGSAASDADVEKVADNATTGGTEAANGTPGGDAEKVADNAPAAAGAETVDEKDGETASAEHRVAAYRNLSGFIEIYGDNFLLEREIVFFGEDDVRETEYVYNKGTLIRTEAAQSSRADSGENAQKIYTDNYRYHRSGSLRSVERTYHERLEGENAILRFAHRVLDAAATSMFQTEQVFLSTEFFDEYSVESEQKTIFTTDERNRILTQTLLDSDGEAIWVIRNIWSGDRIASSLKTEGEDQKLNEYEYNGNGDIVTERNFHNGILQRQMRIEGNREIEELYMNGVVVLRAVWEDGRKVSEQRVRPGADSQNAAENGGEAPGQGDMPEEDGQ
jgi:hypothetical protein